MKLTDDQRKYLNTVFDILSYYNGNFMLRLNTSKNQWRRVWTIREELVNILHSNQYRPDDVDLLSILHTNGVIWERLKEKYK